MSLTAYTDSQDPWGSFHVLCYVGYPISYCKEKDLKKTTPRESKADSQTSLWCSVKSRYLHAYIHMVLRNLLQDSVISFYSIVFFKKKNTQKTNIHCGDIFVLQAKNQKKTLDVPCLSLVSLILWLIEERGGIKSFEEDLPLHFVLISLEVLGQNCLLQK